MQNYLSKFSAFKKIPSQKCATGHPPKRMGNHNTQQSQQLTLNVNLYHRLKHFSCFVLINFFHFITDTCIIITQFIASHSIHTAHACMFVNFLCKCRMSNVSLFVQKNFFIAVRDRNIFFLMLCLNKLLCVDIFLVIRIFCASLDSCLISLMCIFHEFRFLNMWNNYELCLHSLFKLLSVASSELSFWMRERVMHTHGMESDERMQTNMKIIYFGILWHKIVNTSLESVALFMKVPQAY